MKFLLLCGIYLSVLLARGGTCEAKQFSAEKISGARSKYPLSKEGQISTNTLAFEEYALSWMLSEANTIRKKWNLNIPQPLTVDNVLFQAKATPFGLEGGLCTKDGGFDFHFEKGKLSIFSETKRAPFAFRYNDQESDRLARIPSAISQKEAATIARNALHKLGIKEEQLGLKGTVEVKQYKFQESNGKVYPMPVFRVLWHKQGPKRYIAEDLEYEPVTMDISGETKNVVRYYNAEILRMETSILPTNYFELLNLPNYYLDTLPERTRALYGLPPLGTNAPVRKEKGVNP